MGTYEHNWYSHKYLDNRIKQEYDRLETEKVKNRLTSRDDWQ